jgi:hypothetical protein
MGVALSARLFSETSGLRRPEQPPPLIINSVQEGLKLDMQAIYGLVAKDAEPVPGAEHPVGSYATTPARCTIATLSKGRQCGSSGAFGSLTRHLLETKQT